MFVHLFVIYNPLYYLVAQWVTLHCAKKVNHECRLCDIKWTETAGPVCFFRKQEYTAGTALKIHTTVRYTEVTHGRNPSVTNHYSNRYETLNIVQNTSLLSWNHAEHLSFKPSVKAQSQLFILLVQITRKRCRTRLKNWLSVHKCLVCVGMLLLSVIFTDSILHGQIPSWGRSFVSLSG